MTRLLICVPCFNRRAIVAQCLPTLLSSRYEGDEVRCYNDGSTEYNADWLRSLGADWADDYPNLGVDEQRKIHLRDFLGCPEYDFLYLTDSDTLHDPHWRSRLLDIHTRTGLLTCGYHTQTHENMTNNVYRREGDVVYQRFAPGVSYLLSRAQVERIAIPSGPWNWDWAVPAMLGYKCAVSDVSCCDHLGVSGMHDRHAAGYVSTERALNPTLWLQEKRASVLAELKLNESP